MRQHTALYATGGAAAAVALFALWRRRRTRRAPPAAEEAITNVHAVDGSRGRVVGGAATERPEGATLFEGVLAPDECAATLAAIGIRERSERLAREYRAAAAAEAAAAARVRELQREVLKEQRSRTKMRGPRPHPSPLSPVHASLLWRVVGLGPRKAVSRVGAPPSRRPRRRLSLPLALSTARRKLRRTASL